MPINDILFVAITDAFIKKVKSGLFYAEFARSADNRILEKLSCFSELTVAMKIGFLFCMALSAKICMALSAKICMALSAKMGLFSCIDWNSLGVKISSQLKFLSFLFSF